MRKKKSHRAIYGLLGTVVAVTAIGNVAAKEIKLYKAPELRLVQGTEDYDLTEGITYDKHKYELMVEDTRDFDIEVLGKYTVEYSLTPLDEDDERYSDSADTNASKNEDPDLDSAFSIDPEDEPEKDSAADKQETGTKEETDAKADVKTEANSEKDFETESEKDTEKAEAKKEGFFTRLLARLTGHVHAAEVDETKADTLEEKEMENRPVVIDIPETTEGDTGRDSEEETAETKEQEKSSDSKADDRKEESDSEKEESTAAEESESGADTPEGTKADDSRENETDSKKQKKSRNPKRMPWQPRLTRMALWMMRTASFTSTVSFASLHPIPEAILSSMIRAWRFRPMQNCLAFR